MYPALDNRSSLTQTTFKKTLPPSQDMTNAIVELKQAVPSISSFKPHLNTHECSLSLIVHNKSIPIKIVFLRNFPQERPLIFVTQWIRHPIINELSCQVEYEAVFPWQPHSKLADLIKKIQGQLTQVAPTYDSELTKAQLLIENYIRQVESLRAKPPGTQPPPLPNINFETTLKTFEYQENLYSQCEEKNSLYLITAQEYNENLSRVKCVSEKFSKGKIIREMEKQMEAKWSQAQGGNIQSTLQDYYENRKKLHKMKILKELFLES